jgi:hypothetical protein
MNGSWSEYRINQLHRQEKMRQAETYRLAQAVAQRNQHPGHRLAAILASFLALVV